MKMSPIIMPKKDKVVEHTSAAQWLMSSDMRLRNQGVPRQMALKA